MAGRIQVHADRDRVLSRVATALFLLGLISLSLATAWHEDHESSWQPNAKELARQLWPFSLTTAAAILLYERKLRASFVAELVNVSGPRIVEALLPQQVMDTFLAQVYGARPENRDVAFGVMGGEGIRPAGRDLTISTGTTVQYTLQDDAADQYALTSHIDYTFKRPVAGGQFVFFATCDAGLRDMIVLGCELPLFEYWYVPDIALFTTAVQKLCQTARVSVSYIDTEGQRRTTASKQVQLREVDQKHWHEYLAFFRADIGSLKKRRPVDYSSSLDIYECALEDVLAAEPYARREITALHLTSTTLQSKADGYCYWTAPYPCFVEHISFRANDFTLSPSTSPPLFRIVPFSLKANSEQDRWVTASDLRSLQIGSWMLPGHGVALLWKTP